MKHFVKKQWNKNKQLILLGLVAFLFVAGIVQYAFGLTYVLPLTSILLAIISAITLLVWDAEPKTKVAIGLGVVTAGYLVELIGVQTGILFGNYSYGTVLGFKVLGVPVTIGLTWFLVTLSAWHILSFSPNLSVIRKFLLGGALVVMFDLVLEQFAVSYSLWAWQGGDIPLLNYASWFMVSQLFFFIYFRYTKKADPSIFIAGLLPLMALFFWFMLLLK